MVTWKELEDMLMGRAGRLEIEVEEDEESEEESVDEELSRVYRLRKVRAREVMLVYEVPKPRL